MLECEIIVFVKLRNIFFYQNSSSELSCIVLVRKLKSTLLIKKILLISLIAYFPKSVFHLFNTDMVSHALFSSSWTLDVSWTASYEINVVHMSVRLSSFFSHIVHDTSLPSYLVTQKTRYFKNNFGGRNLGSIFVIFLSLDYTFSLKLHTMIAFDNI